jgi:hypothetical protein
MSQVLRYMSCGPFAMSDERRQAVADWIIIEGMPVDLEETYGVVIEREGGRPVRATFLRFKLNENGKKFLNGYGVVAMEDPLTIEVDTEPFPGDTARAVR